MAQHKLYKSCLSSNSYIFAGGNQYIYVDASEPEVDTDNLDPIEQIRRKAVAEYIARQAAANSLTNDRGETASDKLANIGNSTTISPISSEQSNSVEAVDPTSELATLTASLKAKKA